MQVVLKDFETFAKNHLDNINCPSETLMSAIQYSFLNGGKRIRALFVYEMGKIFELRYEDCHKIAFAIEAIHSYSLIHDDLPAMDDDSMRRGKPSLHIVYGEATAILAGDALQPIAFEILQTLSTNSIITLKKINKTISQCSGVSGMVAGQQLDLDGENENLDIDELNSIHINKTAKMFQACLLIPFYLSNNISSNVEETLINMSILIGLCFQIKDDILDATATSFVLGKTSNKDARANKSTYISLLGINGAEESLINNFNEINKHLVVLGQNNYEITGLKSLINLVINRNS